MSHMCETDNNGLHLNIVIMTTECFSPSRNLQLRRLGLDFIMLFKAKIVPAQPFI